MPYAELHCLSCYSFLRSASHPHELVERAAQLGYSALAITDECSLAGMVKAHVAAKELGIQLIVGSELMLEEGIRLLALVPSRAAYSELSGLISMARRRSPKGEYRASLRDVIFHLKRCLLIWLPQATTRPTAPRACSCSACARSACGWASATCWATMRCSATWHCASWRSDLACPWWPAAMCRCTAPAANPCTMCSPPCATTPASTNWAGGAWATASSTCAPGQTAAALPPALLAETLHIAELCNFSLDELRYEYPEEVVPAGYTPTATCASWWHRARPCAGRGRPADIQQRIDRELALIEELNYEYYFLTVYDIVRFARERDILCQGRGSAANSVVCYCLFITEVSPEQISLLFERFISRERDEPPDIDVDFEHERREEVIQYIYRKYSRKRAALAATVITYRSRSAVRDVGKALGLDPVFVDDLAKSLAWWDRTADLAKRFEEQGVAGHSRQAELFYTLVQQILGFPRHLSQHVGGFVITRSPISTLVPVENASMAERTVIQWDKEDIESLGLLKVDILALGMLSAIRKSLQMVHRYCPAIKTISDIPKEDQPPTACCRPPTPSACSRSSPGPRCPCCRDSNRSAFTTW